ncbi:MAG: ABC transporter ATP-binding protein [Clostridiales bacterium]|mgnify:CR=1 FL=1|jgi:NitT/TauT family transport system ATP-binding protein|nr:ABC transporter ATP-binding protein [Clostridiales bacterium]
MLALYEVTKRYGAQTVFEHFTLGIAPGERVCLMGASGCGKTTALRLLAGLELPDAGRVSREGAISLVFQEDRLLRALTPLGNLRLVTGRAAGGQLEGLLSRLGLGDSLNKPVRELSGGMRRRVAIARALAVPFDALLLDEPFKGLDADTRSQAARVILEEAKGKTILLVAHDPAEATLLDARVIHL